MATEGLIDIGILMGSRSKVVFMEQVDIYPGARHLWDVINMVPCSCGREFCVIDTFQFILGEVSEGNKDRAAAFIEKAQGVSTYAALKELLHNEYHAHKVEDARLQSLGDLLGSFGFNLQTVPLVADSGLEYDPSLNNLGHDEPKHSRPSEERPDDPEGHTVQ